MDGTFATIDGVSVAGDVEAFVGSLKNWSASLAGVESRHMKVFGPWAKAPPKMADWTAKLADADAALAPNEALSSLVDTTGDYFFIVRITAPPPAAAAGASVLGWNGAIFPLVSCCIVS